MAIDSRLLIRDKDKQPKHRNKYKAKRLMLDGVKFDSIVEAQYYKLNKWRYGQSMKVHEHFKLLDSFKSPTGKTIYGMRYTPDFTIYDNGQLVRAVDVKGGNVTLTVDSIMRIKLFIKHYGVPVYIARKDKRSKLFVETEYGK